MVEKADRLNIVNENDIEQVPAELEDDNESNKLKQKFRNLEDELQRTMVYLNEQIIAIDEYEEPSKRLRKFRESIYIAKKSIVEQKINTMRTLLSLYVEDKKGEESSNSLGKDITSFLNQ